VAQEAHAVEPAVEKRPLVHVSQRMFSTSNLPAEQVLHVNSETLKSPAEHVVQVPGDSMPQLVRMSPLGQLAQFLHVICPASS
jgi:hypothetical protein